MGLLEIVIPCAVLLFAGLMFLPFYFALIRPARRRGRLLAAGRDGVGVVTAIHDTGVTVNRSIRARLTLRVTPADGSPELEVTAITLVPRLDPMRYAPGAELRVRFDPETRTAAVVD